MRHVIVAWAPQDLCEDGNETDNMGEMEEVYKEMV